MAFKQKRHYNKTPQRRKISGVGAEAQRPRRTPIAPTFNTDALVLTVDFDQPVIWNGDLPNFLGGGAFNLLPVSVAQNSATQFELTYLVTPGTAIRVAFEDPAFRNIAGGYVIDGDHVSTLAP